MIELHHLRYFVTVAETLHFGQAAQQVHISQPALSQQIRALEERLGVQLFERNRQSVALTHAGRLFLTEARQALEQVDHAVKVARQAGRGEVGQFSIGFVGSVLYSFLPEAIRIFRERFPAVELKLRELTSHEQIAALERKQIDIGILHGPLAEPHIDLECILRQPLWVALPRGHAFAERATIHLTELRNETFILASHEHEPALHDRYMSICQQAGFVPQAIQEASQMQTILGLVALDLGVFLVAAYVRNFPHSGVAYVPIAEPAPWVDLYAAWHQRSRSPVLQQFWSVLKEVAAPQ